MTGGTTLLATGAVVAAGDLVMAQLAARSIGQADRAPSLDGRQDLKRAAVRMLRIGAVVIFLIFAALAFGLIPSALIQPIQLH